MLSPSLTSSDKMRTMYHRKIDAADFARDAVLEQHK